MECIFVMLRSRRSLFTEAVVAGMEGIVDDILSHICSCHILRFAREEEITVEDFSQLCVFSLMLSCCFLVYSNSHCASSSPLTQRQYRYQVLLQQENKDTHKTQDDTQTSKSRKIRLQILHALVLPKFLFFALTLRRDSEPQTNTSQQVRSCNAITNKNKPQQINVCFAMGLAF